VRRISNINEYDWTRLLVTNSYLCGPHGARLLPTRAVCNLGRLYRCSPSARPCSSVPHHISFGDITLSGFVVDKVCVAGRMAQVSVYEHRFHLPAVMASIWSMDSGSTRRNASAGGGQVFTDAPPPDRSPQLQGFAQKEMTCN